MTDIIDGQDVIILTVSKRYKHRGRNVKHRPGTRKHWSVSYLSKETGKYRMKFISAAQALIYKSKTGRQKRLYCKCGWYAKFAIKKAGTFELDTGLRCLQCGSYDLYRFRKRLQCKSCMFTQIFCFNKEGELKKQLSGKEWSCNNPSCPTHTGQNY